MINENLVYIIGEKKMDHPIFNQNKEGSDFIQVKSYNLRDGKISHAFVCPKPLNELTFLQLEALLKNKIICMYKETDPDITFNSQKIEYKKCIELVKFYDKQPTEFKNNKGFLDEISKRSTSSVHTCEWIIETMKNMSLITVLFSNEGDNSNQQHNEESKRLKENVKKWVVVVGRAYKTDLKEGDRIENGYLISEDKKSKILESGVEQYIKKEGNILNFWDQNKGKLVYLVLSSDTNKHHGVYPTRQGNGILYASYYHPIDVNNPKNKEFKFAINNIKEYGVYKDYKRYEDGDNSSPNNSLQERTIHEIDFSGNNTNRSTFYVNNKSNIHDVLNKNEKIMENNSKKWTVVVGREYKQDLKEGDRIENGYLISEDKKSKILESGVEQYIKKEGDILNFWDQNKGKLVYLVLSSDTNKHHGVYPTRQGNGVLYASYYHPKKGRGEYSFSINNIKEYGVYKDYKRYDEYSPTNNSLQEKDNHENDKSGNNTNRDSYHTNNNSFQQKTTYDFDDIINTTNRRSYRTNNNDEEKEEKIMENNSKKWVVVVGRAYKTDLKEGDRIENGYLISEDKKSKILESGVEQYIKKEGNILNFWDQNKGKLVYLVLSSDTNKHHGVYPIRHINGILYASYYHPTDVNNPKNKEFKFAIYNIKEYGVYKDYKRYEDGDNSSSNNSLQKMSVRREMERGGDVLNIREAVKNIRREALIHNDIVKKEFLEYITKTPQGFWFLKAVEGKYVKIEVSKNSDFDKQDFEVCSEWGSLQTIDEYFRDESGELSYLKLRRVLHENINKRILISHKNEKYNGYSVSELYPLYLDGDQLKYSIDPSEKVSGLMSLSLIKSCSIYKNYGSLKSDFSSVLTGKRILPQTSFKDFFFKNYKKNLWCFFEKNQKQKKDVKYQYDDNGLIFITSNHDNKIKIDPKTIYDYGTKEHQKETNLNAIEFFKKNKDVLVWIDLKDKSNNTESVDLYPKEIKESEREGVELVYYERNRFSSNRKEFSVRLSNIQAYGKYKNQKDITWELNLETLCQNHSGEQQVYFEYKLEDENSHVEKHELLVKIISSNKKTVLCEDHQKRQLEIQYETITAYCFPDKN